MVKPKVSVLKTSPETVIEDIGRAMALAEFQKTLPKDRTTILKINISWHRFFPGVSTTPWQLEGVIRALRGHGYSQIVGAQNRTVVVSDRVGEWANKQRPVLDRFKIPTHYLNEPETEWIRYEPEAKLRVLQKIFPAGIYIPKMFFGKNIIHLPTMKTHVFTVITGAMKNAFGGLLSLRRHWTHSVIHETLVDLLAIQKELHSGIFALIDGTVVGAGPGPRCLKPQIKNYILASSDQVAIDAVSAKMMGFDPLKIGFIRLATEAGLGIGDLRETEIIGEDISGVNFGFKGQEETSFSRLQKAIYHGWLRPLEYILLRTPLVTLAYWGSIFYHDWFWYNFFGRSRLKKFMTTDWGKLFSKY